MESYLSSHGEERDKWAFYARGRPLTSSLHCIPGCRDTARDLLRVLNMEAVSCPLDLSLDVRARADLIPDEMIKRE